MKKNKRSGQTLLLIALMVTVAVTVVVVVSQNATQQVKIATQEAESKRAFAAAEAGIQAALDQDATGEIPVNFDSLNLSLGDNISGNVIVDDDTPIDTFEPPLLEKDEVYTFYMTDYDSPNNPETRSFTISKLSPQDDETYCDSESTRFALELTFVDLSTNTIAGRRLIDPCSMVAGNEDKINFGDQISDITASFMTVRVLAQEEFEGAKIRINKPGDQTWPAQGKTIESQANTDQQISKRVKLFQSFPQPPAEFYTTRF